MRRERAWFACLLFAVANPAGGMVETHFIPIELGIGGEETSMILTAAGYETKVTRGTCPPERRIIDGKPDLHPRLFPQPRTKSSDSCFVEIIAKKNDSNLNLKFADSAFPPFDRTVVWQVDSNRDNLGPEQITDIKNSLIAVYGPPVPLDEENSWSWYVDGQRISAIFFGKQFKYTINKMSLIVPLYEIPENYRRGKE